MKKNRVFRKLSYLKSECVDQFIKLITELNKDQLNQQPFI